MSVPDRFFGDRSGLPATPGGAAPGQAMRRADAPVWGQALRQNWRRWLEIVEGVARRRGRKCQADAKAYRALHADLIACCRVLADDDKPRRDYYGCLEQLVRPWLTIHVLAQADREVLLSLLLQCQQVDEQLNGPRRSFLGRGARFGLAVVAAAAFLVLARETAAALWLALADQLAGLWRASLSVVQQLTETQRLIAIGFAVALVAMGVAWKTAKS